MADNVVGAAAIELRYSFGKLDADLNTARQKIDQQMSALGRVGAGLKRPFQGLSEKLSSVQGQLVAVAGAVGGIAVGRSIVATNTEFERLGAALKTVQGSAESGRAKFDELVQFAARTPSSVQEVTQAFLALKARGLDSSIGALQSFGDTAAAMGRPLQQFVEAVADAASGEMERLKEFGITASQEGDKVAFTFDGITTVVGKNAEEIGAYLRQIGDTKFAGAQEEQMKTLGGLFSNLGDSLDSLARKVGEAGMNDGLKALLRVFLDVNGAATPLAQRIGELAGGALTKLATALETGLKWFNELPAGMQEFAVKAGAIGAVLLPILPALGLFVTGVAALASPLGLALTAVAGAGAAYIAFKDQVDPALAAVGERLGGFFREWGLGFDSMSSVVAKVSDVGAQVMAAVNLSLAGMPERARVLVGQFRDNFAGTLGELAGAAAAKLLELVPVADKGISDFIGAWTRGSEGVDLLSIVGKFANAAIDAMAAFVQGVGKGFEVDVSAAIKRGIATMTANINAGLATVKQRFTGFWKQQAAEINFLVSDPLTAFKTLATEGTDAFSKAATAAAGLSGPVKAQTDAAAAAVTRMADRVDAETNRLQGMVPPIQAFTEQAAGSFQQLENAVTGNSYYVDMIDAVGQQTLRLADELVAPSEVFAREVAKHYQTMAADSTASIAQTNNAAKNLNPADTELGKKFNWKSGNQKGAAAQTQENKRKERIGDIRAEIDQLKRLNAAQDVSAEEYAKVQRQIAGERAARQLGADATKDERDLVKSLTMEQDALTASLERQRSVRDAQAEVEGLQRIAAATAVSNQEGERVARVVAAEAAARQLGADATKAQRDAIAGATLAQEQATAATEASRAVNDLSTDIAGQERLLTATQAGNAEAQRTTDILAAENAVRQAGLTLQDAAGQRLYDLTLRQAENNRELERARTLQDAATQLDQSNRLVAALGLSTAAYEREREAIVAEQAAVELGLPITDARVKKLAESTLALERNAKAEERIRAIRDLEQELSDTQRLADASLQGAEAYRQTAVQIEAEAFARQNNIPLMSEEFLRIRDMIEAREQLSQIPPPPPITDTNAMAGARDALQQYVTDATMYGRIAGDMLTRTLGEATTGLADILESATGGFENMKDTAVSVFQDFLKSMQRMILEFMAQQIIMGFIQAFAGPTGGAGAAMAGGGAYNGSTNAFTGLTGRMHGAVMRGADISRYSNSVVTQPTFFARGGNVMGEAGPEAILPLMKTPGGDLGVRSVGQGGGGETKVVLNVQHFGGDRPQYEQRSSERDGQHVIDLTIREATRSHFSQGRHDKMMAGEFGVRPTPMR